MYIDGAEAATAPGFANLVSFSPGDGKVVIGRQFTDSDNFYSEAKIDELMMFNQLLSDQQIQELYEIY